MKKIPTIKAVMTPFPYSIEMSASVRRAEMMMAEHMIRHLPVVREGKPVGVLTDRELKPVLDRLQRDADIEKLRVRDICCRDTCIVDYRAPLDAVLLKMAEGRLDSVLVVKDERLVGIFTKTDSYLKFKDLLNSIYPKDGDGDAA